MPELPEVESVKLQLQKFVVGHTIEKVDIRYKNIFPDDQKKVLGARVAGVRRFGKVLVFDLSNDFAIVAQIKMTGQFIYRGPKLINPPELSKKVSGGLGGKHTHVIFYLDNKGILYYNDVRKFGRIRIVEKEKVRDTGLIGKLGPEPFSSTKENLLTREKFKEIVTKTKKPIKIVLMDQEKIGGIGNIYANDALWLSMIHPARPANSLSKSEQSSLYEAIHKVLEKGMKYGGASENSFVTPDGSEGEYQMHSLVYGHKDELCQRCNKEKIKKMTLGGRGTYYCEHCQK